MKMLDYIAFAACLAILLAAVVTPPPASSAALEPTTFVSVEDIGKKVALIGRLGQPLGKLMEVQGKWRLPYVFKSNGRHYMESKDDSPIFTVTHVNGKALKKPVEFDLALVKAVYRGGKNALLPHEKQKTLAGVTWTLRAYETGRFYVEPRNWWEEAGTGPRSPPPWARTLASELVGVVQEGK